MAAMSAQASVPLGCAPSTISVDGRAAIELRGITKRFPGVVANNDIALDVLAGEIHVLLGENGAGKSTLIGILAGLQRPDAGSICVHGRPVSIASPRESLDLGIGTVFQHMQLVPSLTVLENLMLGESLGGRCSDGPRSSDSASSPLFSASRSMRTRRSLAWR